MRRGKLTDKQRRFALEYVKDHNATQAAIRAGYAKKGAGVTAFKLLKNTNIQADIQKAAERAADRAEVEVARILREYAKMAFTDLPGIVDYKKGRMSLKDFDELTPEQRGCIKKYKVRTMTKIVDGDPVDVDHVEIELHDKNHALDMLGKYLGMFTERHDVNVHNGDKELEIRAMFDSMTKEEKLEWLRKNQKLIQ
jgi:phage terminase small subunit